MTSESPNPQITLAETRSGTSPASEHNRSETNSTIIVHKNTDSIPNGASRTGAHQSVNSNKSSTASSSASSHSSPAPSRVVGTNLSRASSRSFVSSRRLRTSTGGASANMIIPVLCSYIISDYFSTIYLLFPSKMTSKGT